MDNRKVNILLLYTIVLLRGLVFYGPIATLYRQTHGLCLNYNFDALLKNNKYRWNKEDSKKDVKDFKMQTLNALINEYTIQLKKGQIQKAYKGIMTFMSELKNYMSSRYPEYVVSSLYLGYMDMTYFAFTPMELKKKNLKIAVVYLHEQNRFEVWLGGSNRKVQAEYIDLLKKMDISCYKLSQTGPGVDSIIEIQIDSQPDFEQAKDLMQKIENKTIKFVDNIISILAE